MNRRSNSIKPKVNSKTSSSKGFDKSESRSGDRKPAKSARSFSDKPFAGKSSKPASRFSDKPSFEKSDRPSKRFSDKPAFEKSERPSKRFSDKPSFEKSDRPSRRFSDKPSFDKGPRKFDEKPSFGRSAKPSRRFEDKPSFDKDTRPSKRFEDKPAFEKSDRPSRRFSDKPSFDKGPRKFDDKPSFGRSAKPSRRFEDKPSFDKDTRPSKRFDDKPAFEKSDRPSKRFSDKPSFDKGPRRFEDKPFKSRSFEDNEESFKKPFNTRQRTKPEFKTGKSIAEKPKLLADNSTRLNKIIAFSGICSRREADDMIKAGLVSVNGKVVTELGTKVKPEDDVRYNGERLRKEKLVYILLNKPKDYVTTSKDPFAKHTVLDLIKGACSERVYPVGRLDRNTTGVLLLTNDGDLTRKLTHPSQNRKKIYQVSLDKNLKQTDFLAIKNGVELEDGFFIKPDAIEFNIEGDKKEVGIEIHSGQNRIVRRIFEKFDYEVTRLDRVYFCGLTKKGLQRGFWRFLTEIEITSLRMGRFE